MALKLLLKTAMTRRRFFNIRSSLKVVFDDDVTAEEKNKNKIWKVALLFDSVLFGCRSQERPIHLSIDEMIVPFSGQCGIRQYCPGKPNPVGIKIFVLASPDGIVLGMLPYQGKTTFPDLIDTGYTLGEAAIIRLCDTLVPRHFLYFDRYFTTIKLADVLLEKGYHGTGTIARNRIPKNCLLTQEKIFMKRPRGTTETKCRNDGTVSIAIHSYQDISYILTGTLQQ
ncbi:Transposase IS4 [Popillia japonica]|uniref:Transposase IS4 n=1 Tax=Popillia japonica TaxID=7064 RepID=A0AAW1ITL6_POPJA